jgi:YidC/Oxa1 family membrane protein insertase
MEKLRPELERIRKRFRKRPERIAEESHKLFKEHGVSPIPLGGCLGGLAQMPVFLAMYSAVRQVVAAGGRFLWIKNIARPDLILTAVVAGITYASIAYSMSGMPQQGKPFILLLPVVATVLVLAKTSAGIGLYWGVSATASLVQTFVIHRYASAQPAT